MQAVHYATLIAGQMPPIDPDQAFDLHVLACILSAAKAEVDEGGLSCRGTTGLEPQELRQLMNRHFPLAALSFLADEEREDAPGALMEEEILRDLLLQHVAPGQPVSRLLARMIACRAMYEDHLWQDLGLLNRQELTRLLRRHFRHSRRQSQQYEVEEIPLSQAVRERSFALCTAPTCRDCQDFENCFGEESGESRLARLKNGFDPRVSSPLQAAE